MIITYAMAMVVVAVLVFPRLSVAVAMMVYVPEAVKVQLNEVPVPVAMTFPAASFIVHATVPVRPEAQVILAWNVT